MGRQEKKRRERVQRSPHTLTVVVRELWFSVSPLTKSHEKSAIFPIMVSLTICRLLSVTNRAEKMKNLKVTSSLNVFCPFHYVWITPNIHEMLTGNFALWLWGLVRVETLNQRNRENRERQWHSGAEEESREISRSTCFFAFRGACIYDNYIRGGGGC